MGLPRKETPFGKKYELSNSFEDWCPSPGLPGMSMAIRQEEGLHKRGEKETFAPKGE